MAKGDIILIKFPFGKLRPAVVPPKKIIFAFIPLKIEKVFFASGSFFKIFTYPLVRGDKNTAWGICGS